MVLGSEPGTIIVQIDGLAEPILRRALEAGRMPTLSRWLARGSHRLTSWECDLPSMTSSGQSGILFGNNANIPAFRWYEKDAARLLVSNHPRDAMLIERRQATHDALLRDHGSSVGNLLSGGAEHVVITMSRLLNDAGQIAVRSDDLLAYFLNPTNLLRALGGIGREIVLETWQGWRQRLLRVEPRMDRGGMYPLVRAVTTVVLRDITTWMLIADMRAGRRVAYADYLGYDEVAHRAGPATADALGILRSVDTQLRRLERAAQSAPRPYRFVVLSDHGQSTGATFSQRYGLTLGQLIERFTRVKANVQMAAGTGEGSGQVRALSREVARIGGPMEPVAKKFITRGARTVEHVRVEQADIVVCASGNLALIYFTDVPVRMTLEAIDKSHPGLIEGLRQHPGIGFLLVQSQASGGPVVLGREGRRNLLSGELSGDDPLAAFSPHTAAMLRRLSSYSNVGDIVVNSLCDPLTQQVAAFEELIGCHGGAGGAQTSPFLLYPADWGRSPTLIGAEQLHRFLREHMSVSAQPELAL